MTSTPFVALPDTLNDAVEFDSPFTVSEPDPSDGSALITAAPADVYAPDVYDVRTMADFTDDQWELVTGYSGQYSYAGPIMHDSEYLGGRMARDVLAEPGTYVVVAAYYGCTDTEHADGTPVTDDDPRLTYVNESGETVTYVDHGECESHGEGWALARLRDADSLGATCGTCGRLASETADHVVDGVVYHAECIPADATAGGLNPLHPDECGVSIPDSGGETCSRPPHADDAHTY